MITQRLPYDGILFKQAQISVIDGVVIFSTDDISSEFRVRKLRHGHTSSVPNWNFLQCGRSLSHEWKVTQVLDGALGA